MVFLLGILLWFLQRPLNSHIMTISNFHFLLVILWKTELPQFIDLLVVSYVYTNLSARDLSVL